MGPDKLDDFIKRKVQNLETDSDTSLLWQKIQAKQQAKKKDKRRFFFLWFFAGVLCLTCGSFLFFQFSNSTQETKITKTQHSVKSTHEPITKSFKNPPLSKSSETTSNTDLQQVSEKDSKEYSNSSLNNKGSDQLVNPPNTKKEESIKDDPKDDLLNRSIYSKPIAKSKLVSPKTQLKEADENALKNPNTTSQSSNETIESLNHIPIAVLNPLPLRSSALNVPNYIKELKKESLTLPKDGLKTNAKKHMLITGLHFNYGAIKKNLTSTNTDYLQIRKNNETPLDVFNIGMNIKFQHRNNLYLKTGLEYQQINERFGTYETWDSTIIQPNQIITITYDIDGQSSNTLGDGLVDETYFTSKKVYNRYRFIEIPIAFGYASSKRKLNWFIDGGLALNLWFQPSGEITSESGSSILLSDDRSYFKSNTGLSLIGSVGISYQYNQQWSLTASPNFKYQIKSIASNQNLVDQQYFLAGLQLGINFHW